MAASNSNCKSSVRLSNLTHSFCKSPVDLIFMIASRVTPALYIAPVFQKVFDNDRSLDKKFHLRLLLNYLFHDKIIHHEAGSYVCDHPIDNCEAHMYI